jgi:hypothetical protein
MQWIHKGTKYQQGKSAKNKLFSRSEQNPAEHTVRSVLNSDQPGRALPIISFAY